MQFKKRTIEMKQLCPVGRDVNVNLATVQQSIRETDADILLFPELFISGYEVTGLDAIAMRDTDDRLQALVEESREAKVSLVVGYLEEAAGLFYDSYFAIDGTSGAFQTVRKTHLFGAENSVFARGNSLQVISLSEIRVGFMNCVEIEFPEIARTLALRGAEVFLVGSANMHPYFNDHRIACEGRAIENKRPLIYVNRVGQESGFRFCGGSRSVNARGEIITELDESLEESCVVSVELGEPVTAEIDFLEYLRPELYQNAKAPMG